MLLPVIFTEVKRIRYVIEKIEGEIAEVEGLGIVPRALLPKRATEGDVLTVEVGDDGAHLFLDPTARAEAEAETRRLKNALKSLDLSGDDPLEL